MSNIGLVVGVELYANDAVVIRHGHAPHVEDHTRGDITVFSDKARARLAFVANNTTVTFRTMITLTYPKEYPRDGSIVKKDLRRFLAAWRAYTRGANHLWFLEFQRRGAPHVHILTDYPCPPGRPARKNLRLWVANKWYDVCGQLDPKHLLAGTRTERLRSPEGGAHYAVKYASKMRQKSVPEDYRNVGRFWGHTRAVRPEPILTFDCSEQDLREALVGEPYEPPTDRPLWRVLYNKAGCIAGVAVAGLDTDD